MAQNTTNDCANIKDTKANVLQIILQNEFIYLIKLVVFIFVVFTVFIGFEEIENVNVRDFVGTFTFILTTTIDSVVLAKAFKVKGKINIILIVYIFLLFLSVGFVALVFAGELEISLFSICVCNLINIFCCLSPILEMIYDVISHLQNEKNRNY